MGSAALKRFNDKVADAFIAGTPVCWSGYYHGIVERAFLGQPEDKLAVRASSATTRRSTSSASSPTSASTASATA
jgi:hypothetical protein